MLLQIEEPGKNKQRENLIHPAIGIDLGTTNSVVAIVKDGQPRTIQVAGKNVLPSIVSFIDRKTIVGEDATNSTNTFRSTKRLFDRPNEFIENSTETPITIAARILDAIKNACEKDLGHEIKNAVISVPAYFDEPARQATKKAAETAGLNVLRLINEPTAAALAYHLEHQNEGIFAVYDFGGGTFDFSLLRLDAGVFQVLAVGGDTQLGGDDIDHAIIDHLKNQDIKIDFQTAKHIKEYLATHTEFAQDGICLNAQELHNISAPFAEKTLQICAKTLRDADVKVDDVKGVILVGGSTRLLGLKEKIKNFFGKDPLVDINPDEVVAHGVALQAHALTYGSENLLLDVTPLSLGLETMGGIVEKIIPRNSPLPCHMAQDFTTYVDGQTMMDIHIVQGERELAKDCRSLGRFILKNIPPMKSHQPKIRISFQMDVDGLLTVTAKELSTGIAQHVEVKPQYELDAKTIEEMILGSIEHNLEDIEARLLYYAKNEASQVLLEVEKALQDLGESFEEHTDLWKAFNMLKSSIDAEDREVIKANLVALTSLAEPLAQRKIQKAIEESLATTVS